MNPRSMILDMTRRFREIGIPDPEVDSAALLAFLCARNPLELRLDTETEPCARGVRSVYRSLPQVPHRWSSSAGSVSE